MKAVIKLSPDTTEFLTSAVAMGALRDACTLTRQEDKGDVEKARRCALEIMHALTNAQPDQRPARITFLSDDDKIRACNFMESEAEAELAKAPGHFGSNYHESLRSIAKAFYHADDSNRRLVEVMYGDVIYHFHMRRLTKTDISAAVAFDNKMRKARNED